MPNEIQRHIYSLFAWVGIIGPSPTATGWLAFGKLQIRNRNRRKLEGVMIKMASSKEEFEGSSEITALHDLTSKAIDSAEPRSSRDRARRFSPAAHGLRGVACILVLIAHIFQGAAEHVYRNNDAYVSFAQIPSLLGTYGVYLFFAISGYVILPSAMRYSPKEFALRRWWRVYPLFFSFSVFFVILNAATNAYPKLNSIESIVAGFLFLDIFTPTEQLTPNAWSLSYEVMFYILVSLCVYSLLRQRRVLIRAAAFGLAAAFVLLEPLSVYFLIGVGIRLLHNRRGGDATRSSRVLEALALLLVLYAVSQGRNEYDAWHEFDSPTLIATVTSTGMYFYLATLPGSLSGRMLANRLTTYVGTVSYSLYLVHPYVYFPTRELFAQFGLFTDAIVPSMFAFFLVVTFVSFGASHVAHMYLERRPYEWFFRQGIYRREAQPGPAR